jgi:hypothetical protein
MWGPWFCSALDKSGFCSNLELPSGKRLQKAIEHGPVEIVDLPINSMAIFHSYVNVDQRVTWQHDATWISRFHQGSSQSFWAFQRLIMHREVAGDLTFSHRCIWGFHTQK